MTRNLPGINSPASASASQPDLTTINLTRLLGRLEQNILSSSADLKTLRQSPYHRSRVGANINHARTLLLHLEHNLPQIRIQSQKKSTQADLAQKRQLIKRLSETLAAIAQESEALEDEDDGTGSEVEDLIGDGKKRQGNAGEKKATTINTDVSKSTERRGSANDETSEAALTNPQQEATPDAEINQTLKTSTTTTTTTTNTTSGISESQPATNPSISNPTEPNNHHQQLFGTSRLRNRRNPQQQDASTTSISSSNKNPNPNPNQTTLLQNDTTQTTLLTQTLTLASALKEQSLLFQSTLRGSDAAILSSALKTLEKNRDGMAAAGERIGLLKRMSEGKGWWGRMMLYAWILGLWVVAVGLVFLGPKVRF